MRTGLFAKQISFPASVPVPDGQAENALVRFPSSDRPSQNQPGFLKEQTGYFSGTYKAHVAAFFVKDCIKMPVQFSCTGVWVVS